MCNFWLPHLVPWTRKSLENHQQVIEASSSWLKERTPMEKLNPPHTAVPCKFSPGSWVTPLHCFCLFLKIVFLCNSARILSSQMSFKTPFGKPCFPSCLALWEQNYLPWGWLCSSATDSWDCETENFLSNRPCMGNAHIKNKKEIWRKKLI